MDVNMKKAVIVVSFGTSYKDARENSLEEIYKEFKAVTEEMEEAIIVYQAYTSGMILQKLFSQGIKINTVEEAIREAINNHVKCLCVIPTHMIPGFEYKKMLQVLEKYKTHFEELQVASPVLAEKKDCMELVPILCDILKFHTEYEYILMGHGTEDDANIRYEQMNQALIQKGINNAHIASVEARPDLDDIIECVQKKKNVKKIILHPFMIVAGDHAQNDMAGEEDSYVTRLREAGYQTETVIKGLGEYPQFRKIYINKLINMI